MIGIPPLKYRLFKQLILYTLQYRVITGAALESLCGTIMHWAQLKQPTKALCWNLLRFIYVNIRSGKYPKNHNFILPLSILNDLKYWYFYADQILKVPMSEILMSHKISISASTDASSSHGGFVLGGYWSYYPFTINHTKDWHINQKEAHVVLSSLHTFRHYLTGKTVHLFIDNESCFYAIKRKWSSSYNMMLFIYELCHLMLAYKFLIWIDWISSSTNGLSDALSRLKLNDFWSIVNTFNLNMTRHKTETVYFSDFKFINKQIIDPNNPFQDTDYDTREYQDFIQFLCLPLKERARIGYPNYASNFQLE